MAFADSYFLIFLLAGLSIGSFVFFFFFLPSKGEKHTAVRVINEMERIIERFRKDKDGTVAANMRKKFQKHKTELSLMSAKEVETTEDLNRLNKVTQALSLYIEGKWRLQELQEDDARVSTYFKRALESIDEVKKDKQSITVMLEDEEDEKKIIEIDKQLAALTELAEEQMAKLARV